MADYTGTIGQTVNGVVSNILDKDGNVTTPVNPPVWSTSNDSILVMTPSGDSMTATGSLLAAGTVSVVVTIDGILQTKSIDVNTGQPGPVASFDLNLTVGAVTARKR